MANNTSVLSIGGLCQRGSSYSFLLTTIMVVVTERVSSLFLHTFLIFMHLPQNLIHRMTVVPVTFASLYQGDGIYVLQISRGEGLNIINPQTAGFTFENTTSNQTILPRGAGDQYYFVLSQMDRYSLKLEGVEVWSHDPNAYPETPKVYPETSEVCIF